MFEDTHICEYLSETKPGCPVFITTLMKFKNRMQYVQFLSHCYKLLITKSCIGIKLIEASIMGQCYKKLLTAIQSSLKSILLEI